MRPAGQTFFFFLFYSAAVCELEGKIRGRKDSFEIIGLLLHGWPDERARPEGGGGDERSFII